MTQNRDKKPAQTVHTSDFKPYIVKTDGTLEDFLAENNVNSFNEFIKISTQKASSIEIVEHKKQDCAAEDIWSTPSLSDESSAAQDEGRKKKRFIIKNRQAHFTQLNRTLKKQTSNATVVNMSCTGALILTEVKPVKNFKLLLNAFLDGDFHDFSGKPVHVSRAKEYPGHYFLGFKFLGNDKVSSSKLLKLSIESKIGRN